MQAIAPASVTPNAVGVDPGDLYPLNTQTQPPRPASAWSFDPVAASGAKTMLTGHLYAQLIHVWRELPIGPTGDTNLYTWVEAAGSGLSNCSMALYSMFASSGAGYACNLLFQLQTGSGAPADISSQLGAGSTGAYAFGSPLAPMVIPVGLYYVAIWQNGTPAALYRGGNALTQFGNWPNTDALITAGVGPRSWSEAGHTALAATAQIGAGSITLEVPWWAGIQQT